MPLITSRVPEKWQELQTLVRGILSECGMKSEQNVPTKLVRGSVKVDVRADETVQGIKQIIICECKNWNTNVPQNTVHAFMTVVEGAGAHRGYIISRKGFQSGAFEAAKVTNIELVTFAKFQEIYFDKWIKHRIKAIEDEVGNINYYYELSRPGYALLGSDNERAAYDAVWNRYLFVGLTLSPHFSPYVRMSGPYPFPPLPFDYSKFGKRGSAAPADLKAATGYREFLELLTGYAKAGLAELRAVNPNTRGKPANQIERDD
jgi:hypothetical protein